MKVLAVDIGSSSARVMMVDSALNITELARIPHSAYLDINGSYRWNISGLFDKLISEIDAALLKNEISGIGVCSWGVDYGVTGDDGTLIDDPYCYRDLRNEKTFVEFFNEHNKFEVFSKNGIFPIAINSVYQLLADIKEKRYTDKKVKIVMIADLLAYRLTGNIRAELSNAGTTQLLNLNGDNWDFDLIKEYGIDIDIFPEVIRSGEYYGEYKGAKVIAVGTHDTASAIYAMGGFNENEAFLSSGSWLLLGKLLDKPLINRKVFEKGYTNERVCDGKVSLLANMNGLFVIQRIVTESGVSYKDIDEHIDNAHILGVLDTEKLTMQNSMISAVNAMLEKKESNIYDIAKTVYFSLATKLSNALSDLENVTESKISKIVLSGGASKAKYFLNCVKELCGVDVEICAGEGAVLGNAMRQFKALS